MTEEAEWIRQGPDLAALGSGPEYGWLKRILEGMLIWLSSKATMVSVYFSTGSVSCQIPLMFASPALEMYGQITSLVSAGFIERYPDDLEQHIFRTAEQRTKSGDGLLLLTASGWFETTITILLPLLTSVLFIVPVFVLNQLQPRSAKDYGLMTNLQCLAAFLFTLLFAFCCSMFTRKERRQEVFAATAAYSAVLAVFIGNSNFPFTITT